MSDHPLLVECAECEGTGFVGEMICEPDNFDCWPCAKCDESGEAPGVCETCEKPATRSLSDGMVLCEEHFFVCYLCDGAAPEDDRLPFGDGVAHAECAIRISCQAPSQFLESAAAGDTFLTSEVSAHALTRSDRQGPHPVPKANQKLLSTMASDGFIPVPEVERLTGHSHSTLYTWIAEGRLRAKRAGLYHFVEKASLEECCPWAFQPRKAAR
jgi:hypothetical protein